MAKFAIECPKCGSISTASTFIFAKKIISCATCGTNIDIKASRLTSKTCPHCGKVFVYDQIHSKVSANGKREKWRCPSCGEAVDGSQTATTGYRMVRITCPQCSCSVEVDGTQEVGICPVCDCHIDVKKTVARQKLVNDTGISVIQYEGDNSTFVWKHPIENFNSGSILIVHESQEAVFFLGGQALDLFGPGRHVLETEKLPVLKKINALPTGCQDPFHAEVYFINKAVHMGMKWGTDSKVRFIDPQTGIPLEIGACGEMNMVVTDSRKLLVKLVGTTNGLKDKHVLESEGKGGEINRTLQSYFKAPLMTEIKAYLATVIKEQKLNLFELDSQMGLLSDALGKRISPKFEEYGVSIPQFYITNILLPEEDKNFKDIKALISTAYINVKKEEVEANVAEAARQKQIIHAQTEAQLNLIKAQTEAESEKMKGIADAEVMHAKGYNQKDIIQADVQKAYAEGFGKIGANGSTGSGMVSDFVGMYAGMKMAGDLFGQLENVIPSPTPQTLTDESNTKGKCENEIRSSQQDTWECSSCKEIGNTGKFCMNCGAPKPELWTCVCGHSGNHGKFCENCGAPRPISWDCTCGKKDNLGKFCPECGNKMP